jgi:hypothetical protein
MRSVLATVLCVVLAAAESSDLVPEREESRARAIELLNYSMSATKLDQWMLQLINDTGPSEGHTTFVLPCTGCLSGNPQADESLVSTRNAKAYLAGTYCIFL